MIQDNNIPDMAIIKKIHLSWASDAEEIINNKTINIPLNEDNSCLLYTSDAADERSSVDLGGRRIIKKKKKKKLTETRYRHKQTM